MEGKHEHVHPAAEVVEAEKQLTPEQAVGSRARYEIRKHKEVLESVGVTEQQINEASMLASDKAVQEYRELAQQEPWQRTMGVIEEIKAHLSPDEKILLEGLTSWSKDFVFRWKERIDMVKTRLGQEASISELVRDIDQNGAPSSILQWGEPLQDFPSFLLFSPKVRSLVDPEAEQQRETAIEADRRMPVTQPRKPFGENEPWNEVIRPTQEGIANIFKTFGAELPAEDQLSDMEKRGWSTRPIPTRFEGVYLGLSSRGDTVWLAFDLETLTRMVDVQRKTGSTEIE